MTTRGTVLITGAAGGIGRAAKDALESAGTPVLGLDLGPAQDTGLALSGDLREEAVLDAVAQAVRGTDRLEAVVAAHGIAGAGALHEMSTGQARRIMQINTESVIRLWETVRPALETSRGAFVVVASQAALVAEADNGIYCASKAALTGWLRGLAGTTTARLRLVHPGATSTPLLHSALQGMAQARGVDHATILAERSAATPVGRLGTPADMGSAIAWATSLETASLVEVAVTGGEVRW